MPTPAKYWASRALFSNEALKGLVYNTVLPRSKQATEYLQHPPIGSLSFGSVWTGDIANTLFGDIANS